MKNFARQLSILVLSASVVACGGGGGKSSSGGGAVVYRGSETVRFTAADDPDSPLLVRTFPLRIEVRDRSVRVTNVDNDVFSGSLSGSSFTASGVIPLGNLGSGVTCADARVTYQGKVNGGTITGSMSTTTPCSGFGATFRMRLQGSFSVSRNARQAGATSGVTDGLREAIDALR